MKRLSIEQLEPRQLMHGDPVHTGPLPDVDGDGSVGASDVSMVLASWGTGSPRGDATGDGHVGASDISSILAAWGQQPHGDDAAKHAEHTALLKLFNVRTTTAAVMRSGDWSDPTTWLTGEVPAADAVVWVPAWYTLTVDGDVEAKHVRVDGTLAFAANSHLTVDTLVGSTTAHLDIDLPNADETARITFAGEAIDTDWDKLATSRGLVWHGSSDIMGAEKTTWSRTEPTAVGDTEIVVTDTTGWRVGDRLVIGGAEKQSINYRDTLAPANDDVRIVAIDGNTITLDRPLAFAHAAIDTQNPVVVNMTRNVVFESASADLDKRGHVMFMHNPDQHIAYAEFNDLGRTDKSRVHTTPDGQGGGLDNPLGRYALHFHRTGSAAQAVEAMGNAISGSPGWGLVNHDSNVLADSNVSYDVFGAHYVTELGNEHGSFTNNVAIRADGTGESVVDVRGSANDIAHQGNGFWLEGGDVPVIGNVAIGMRQSGFTFFSPDAAPDYDQPIVFQNNISLLCGQSFIFWESRYPHNRVPTDSWQNLQFSDVSGNFFHGGGEWGYSGTINFHDNVMVAAFGNRWTPWAISHTGINANIRYINNTITGFEYGIQAPAEGFGMFEGGYFDNRQSNIFITNTQQNFARSIAINGVQFGPTAKWNVNMSVTSFHYNLDSAYGPNQWGVLGAVPDWRLLFAENNTAVGNASHVTYDGVPLYFTEQAADFKFGELLYRFPDVIRYEPDGVTLATGASLNARGLFVGGQPLPAGEQYYQDKIRGVFVAQ